MLLALRVQRAHRDAQDAHASGSPSAPASARARGFLEVEDTGKGILPEHRRRVFEPFFTTKDVWSNVGLGLSVAYRIVSEAGGTIDMRSEVGKGACFTVWLTKA